MTFNISYKCNQLKEIIKNTHSKHKQTPYGMAGGRGIVIKIKIQRECNLNSA